MPCYAKIFSVFFVSSFTSERKHFSSFGFMHQILKSTNARSNSYPIQMTTLGVTCGISCRSLLTSHGYQDDCRLNMVVHIIFIRKKSVTQMGTEICLKCTYEVFMNSVIVFIKNARCVFQKTDQMGYVCSVFLPFSCKQQMGDCKALLFPFELYRSWSLK